MTGDSVDYMKLASFDVRAKKSDGDSALALIRLVLDGDYLVDCFEKLPHVLARAAAMDKLRRANSALKFLRAVNEEVSKPDQRCRQFRVHRLTRKEPRQERWVFKIIGASSATSRSRRNTSVPRVRRTVTRVSLTISSARVSASFARDAFCANRSVSLTAACRNAVRSPLAS